MLEEEIVLPLRMSTACCVNSNGLILADFYSFWTERYFCFVRSLKSPDDKQFESKNCVFILVPLIIDINFTQSNKLQLGQTRLPLWDFQIMLKSNALFLLRIQCPWQCFTTTQKILLAPTGALIVMMCQYWSGTNFFRF